MAQVQPVAQKRSNRPGVAPAMQPEPNGSAVSASSPIRLFMTSDGRAVTGLSRTHLDFYIREGLVQPAARTESGYLLFDHAEVGLLTEIIHERRSGVPLKDIRHRIGR